jgi:hypothetical protein
MNATILGIVITLAVMNLGIVYFLVNRIDRRLERIEDRLTRIEVAQATYAQRLDDHIAAHPGPSTHLVTQ